MKYVVLYVGHLYDSFWTLNGSRTPEINSNQSESVGGGHLGSISGVLGTFGGLWGAPKPN